MDNFELLIFRVRNLFSPSFRCPICNYRGPFKTARPDHPLRRKYAHCPKCNSSERQRVQWLILHELSSAYSFKEKTLLHFAPETLFRSELQKLFKQVTTTDLAMPDVDVNADICSLPFPDEAFDVVFASHVLEHVKQDRRAMGEIRRVLRPEGLAVIEVPIVRRKTIEYEQPNPHEYEHVRSTGPDYYDRFTNLFKNVKKISSDEIPPKFQPYIYCDWTGFPTPESPLRQPLPGKRHPIVIAVYFV